MKTLPGIRNDPKPTPGISAAEMAPPLGISTGEAQARAIVGTALAKRAAYFAAKAESDRLEEDWRDAEAQACEAMDLADCSNLRFDGVGLVVRTTAHQISVNDKDALFAALDSEGLLEELTEMTVRRAALREKLLARVKAGQEYWPGIEYFAKPTLAVRKAK